ncbi:MAG: class I SAM-dependent methyltransferase [Chloroherpetonaceae bacterium]|nr:class I SAM-dependent methyltransferase [Chloroherpetonaceae bacterium]
MLSPINLTNDVKLVNKISYKFISDGYNFANVKLHEFYKIKEFVEIYKCNQTGLLFADSQLKEGDGQFYNELSKNDWYYVDTRWFYDFVLQKLNANSKILEIGCGKGSFLNLLKKHNFNHLGIDFNNEAVNHCLSMGLNASTKSTSELFEMNQKYDFIFAFEVLEHIKNINEFFLNLKKILKLGGMFCFSVPNSSNPIYFVDEYLKISDFLNPDSYKLYRIATSLNLPPHHFNYFNINNIKKIAEFYGFTLNYFEYQPYNVDLTDTLISLYLNRYIPFLNIYKKSDFIFSKLIKIAGFLLSNKYYSLRGQSIYCELKLTKI